MLASQADYHHALNGTRMGVRWYTMRRGMARPRKVDNSSLPADLQEQISRTSVSVLFSIGESTASTAVEVDGIELSLPREPAAVSTFAMVAHRVATSDYDGLFLDFKQWPPVVERVTHVFSNRFKSSRSGKMVKEGDILIGFGSGDNRFSIELPPPPSWPHYGRYGENEEGATRRQRGVQVGPLKFTQAMVQQYIQYCVDKTSRPLCLHFIDSSVLPAVSSC